MSTIRIASVRSSVNLEQAAILAALMKIRRAHLVAVAVAAEAGDDAEDVVQDVCLDVLEGRLHLDANPVRALRALEDAIRRALSESR